MAKYLITDFKKVKNVFINVIILVFLIFIIGQIENFFPQYSYILKLFQFSLIILIMYSPVFLIPFILNLIFGDPIKKHFRDAQLTLDKLLKENSYLFSWNNVPGKDNDELLNSVLS